MMYYVMEFVLPVQKLTKELLKAFPREQQMMEQLIICLIILLSPQTWCQIGH